MMGQNTGTLKILFICCFLGIVFNEPAQISLSSSDPYYENNSDLNAFDPVFRDIRVVCIGESTHGTHEFFTMRHRVFKYLVENHGFTTFFLETDYGSCLSANRYVKGEHDDITEAIRNIRLWPWITEEMVELLNWMRAYNEQHGNQLSFLGSDVQFFSDAQRELDLIIQKYDASSIDTTLKLTKPDYFRSTIMVDSLLVRQIVEHKIATLTKLNLTEPDKIDADALIKNMEQAIITKEAKEYWMRDYLMGQNMKTYLSRNPNSKVFYWAHNGHVINNLTVDNIGNTITCSAGSVLKESFKEKCLIILQDFKEGSFNVLVERDEDGKTLKEQWEMQQVELPSYKKFAAAQLDFSAGNLWIMSSLEIDKLKRNRIRSIGAIYRFYRHHYKNWCWGLKKQHCDWVIFHEKSTPTKLL